jgi:hypothetical protein
MFNFFKKKPVDEIQVSPESFTYVSDISGNAVDYVRYLLSLRTSKFPVISNAWLAKVKYGAEAKTRIMFLVDSIDNSSECQRSIAEACSDVIPMDITFSYMLPTEFTDLIKRKSAPLYISNAQLFHCPIVAKQNHNGSIPNEWIGAIVNIYVADLDHYLALQRAVKLVVEDGYNFEGVYEDRISQLSPDNWWADHVLALWPQYTNHFPNQDEIYTFIRCGGILKGPVLGYETES